MATTRILAPQLIVKLHKLVRRTLVNDTLPASTRFSSQGRVVDLTPLFSDMGNLHTSKSVRSPAGAFTMTFSDVPQTRDGTLETLYGLIEPMDGIEIRMAHNHRETGGAAGGGLKPRIVMRGFVSRISRTQAVDSEGRPQRTVTVEGHDYGKIWQIIQILYSPFFVLGDTWLSRFRAFERFGLQLSNMTGNELVTEVLARVLNPHLAGMLPQDWSLPRSITPICTVPHGLTSVTGPQNQEGTIHNLLATFGDVGAGFNELFIQDTETAVECVYRPSPALDLDGTPIQPIPGAPAAAALDVLPAEDIISLDLSRSDADVANYFWVEDPRFEMVRQFPMQVAAAGAARNTVYQEDYPNNNPAIYGLRPMILATQMGESPSFLTGQTAAVDAQRSTEIVRWLDERRRILSRTNRDNVLLETGSARVAGNERLRAGQHITIGRGALAATYYVAAVMHDYQPFRGFFTTLQLERGQGFAKRIQAGPAVSPWLLEHGAGAPRQASQNATDIGQAQPGAAT